MPDSNGGRNPQRNRWTPDGSGGPSVPRPRMSPWLIVPLLLVGLLLFNSWLSHASTNTIDYSQFVNSVQSGEIVGTVDISTSDVSGQYKQNGQTTSFTAKIGRASCRERVESSVGAVS